MTMTDKRPRPGAVTGAVPPCDGAPPLVVSAAGVRQSQPAASFSPPPPEEQPQLDRADAWDMLLGITQDTVTLQEHHIMDTQMDVLAYQSRRLNTHHPIHRPNPPQPAPDYDTTRESRRRIRRRRDAVDLTDVGLALALAVAVVALILRLAG